jgi:hypothetical protein
VQAFLATASRIGEMLRSYQPGLVFLGSPAACQRVVRYPSILSCALKLIQWGCPMFLCG